MKEGIDYSFDKDKLWHVQIAKGPMFANTLGYHGIGYEDGNAIQAGEPVRIYQGMEHVTIGVIKPDSSTELPSTTDSATTTLLLAKLIIFCIFIF